MQRTGEKKKRWLELILVLTMATLIPILISLYTLVTGKQIYIVTMNFDITFANAILTKLIAIAALIYILFKQGRSIYEIGYSFTFKDFWHSIILTIAAYFIYYFVNLILYSYLPNIDLHPKNIDFMKGKI